MKHPYPTCGKRSMQPDRRPSVNCAQCIEYRTPGVTDDEGLAADFEAKYRGRSMEKHFGRG